MSKAKISRLILTAIGLIGGILVAEQYITEDNLADIQAYAGMALSGGTLSIGLVLGAINLIPKSVVDKVIEKIGEAKIVQFFNMLTNIFNVVTELKEEVATLKDELLAERQARIEMGVYNNDMVTQETKDKLGV